MEEEVPRCMVSSTNGQEQEVAQRMQIQWKREHRNCPRETRGAAAFGEHRALGEQGWLRSCIGEL